MEGWGEGVRGASRYGPHVNRLGAAVLIIGTDFVCMYDAFFGCSGYRGVYVSVEI